MSVCCVRHCDCGNFTNRCGNFTNRRTSIEQKILTYHCCSCRSSSQDTEEHTTYDLSLPGRKILTWRNGCLANFSSCTTRSFRILCPAVTSASGYQSSICCRCSELTLSLREDTSVYIVITAPCTAPASLHCISVVVRVGTACPHLYLIRICLGTGNS